MQITLARFSKSSLDIHDKRIMANTFIPSLYRVIMTVTVNSYFTITEIRIQNVDWKFEIGRL